MQRHEQRTFRLLLSGSTLALLIAFISEYGFGLKPCTLCIYQRIPYAIVIAASLIPLLRQFPASLRLGLLLLSFLSLGVDAGIAFYHVGVEQGWFEELDTCAGLAFPADDPAKLLESLMATEAVRCDVPAFVFLGLSMAGWNMLYALALLGVSYWIWRNPKEMRP